MLPCCSALPLTALIAMPSKTIHPTRLHGLPMQGGAMAAAPGGRPQEYYMAPPSGYYPYAQPPPREEAASGPPWFIWVGVGVVVALVASKVSKQRVQLTGPSPSAIAIAICPICCTCQALACLSWASSPCIAGSGVHEEPQDAAADDDRNGNGMDKGSDS